MGKNNKDSKHIQRVHDINTALSMGKGWHTINKHHYAVCDNQESAHNILDVGSGNYWEHDITLIFNPLKSRIELDGIYCKNCKGDGAINTPNSYFVCPDCDMNKLLDEGSICHVVIIKDEHTKQSWVNKIRRDCYKNGIEDVKELRLRS